MKIDEFIKEVEPFVDVLKTPSSYIMLYAGDTYHTGEPFLTLDPKAYALIDKEHWEMNNLHFDDTFEVMKLVKQLKNTPVKDRFSEKKYYLCLGYNGDGQKIYLTKVNAPTTIATTVNCDCLTTWTDDGIAALKENFPLLAPAINGMKEPAEEGDDNAC